MKGVATSFHGLTAQVAGVQRIEIPIVQRDYAQGREDDATTRIRSDFLAALHTALTGDTPLSLDFIFGAVCEGAFTPLDGQQRLTTLFLLHRYLAWRAGLPCEGAWTRFSYATRASARAFCEALVTHRLGLLDESVAAFLHDQSWFLSTWRHDPTVQAMLVMLDAIHEKFDDVDVAATWQRLTAPDNPAVQFHLLPIEGIGAPVDLYLKMNARGKPLTRFEHFKARFERLLEDVDRDLAKRFAEKIDGAWSDMLWPMLGDDKLIDDKFLRYIGFIAECCTWAEQRSPERVIERRAEFAFGPENPKARDNLVALMDDFDTWCKKEPEEFFTDHFSLGEHKPGKLTLFPGSGRPTANLLDACCSNYNLDDSAWRPFSLERTLLLDAVLVHRREGSSDFARRLRALRNVIEAAAGSLRTEVMPAWIIATRIFVRDGNLEGLRLIHTRQVDDEQRKATLLSEHPSLADTLFALEDHPLLRGCLTAFDLGPERFIVRANVFLALFSDHALSPLLAQAMLAAGDHDAKPDHNGVFKLPVTQYQDYRDFWNSIKSRMQRYPPNINDTQQALKHLLDEASYDEGPWKNRLTRFISNWVNSQHANSLYDWRTYFVKYKIVNAGGSGHFAALLKPQICLPINAFNSSRASGYNWDPLLRAAMAMHHGDSNIYIKYKFRGDGYNFSPIELLRSGIKMYNEVSCFSFTPPTQPAHAAAYAAVCAAHGVLNNTLPIPQKQHDGQSVDAVDRVQLGAKLLRALVAAGL